MKAKEENAHGEREVGNEVEGIPYAGSRMVTGGTMSENGHKSQAGVMGRKEGPVQFLLISNYVTKNDLFKFSVQLQFLSFGCKMGIKMPAPYPLGRTKLYGK